MIHGRVTQIRRAKKNELVASATNKYYCSSLIIQKRAKRAQRPEFLPSSLWEKSRASWPSFSSVKSCCWRLFVYRTIGPAIDQCQTGNPVTKLSSPYQPFFLGLPQWGERALKSHIGERSEPKFIKIRWAYLSISQHIKVLVSQSLRDKSQSLRVSAAMRLGAVR